MLLDKMISMKHLDVSIMISGLSDPFFSYNMLDLKTRLTANVDVCKLSRVSSLMEREISAEYPEGLQTKKGTAISRSKEAQNIVHAVIQNNIGIACIRSW